MVSVRRRVSIIKIAMDDFQDMLTNLQPNKSNEYFQKLITGDPSHPAHQFFDPLPSGQHPSSIRSHTPPPTPHPDHPPTNQSHGLGNPHDSGRSHTDSVCTTSKHVATCSSKLFISAQLLSSTHNFVVHVQRQ